MAESNTWEEIESLENAKEVVEEFEKEYWWDMEDVWRQEQEEGTFKRGELLERFMVRKLFGWYHKWLLTDLWVDDSIIKRLKKAMFRQ